MSPKTIHLEPRHLRMVADILSRYPYTFYVFGSRAKGTHKRLSDLDLCYFDHIPDLVIGDLEELFEESNLPFTVDLVRWQDCQPNFQKLIEKDLIKLEYPEKEDQ